MHATESRNTFDMGKIPMFAGLEPVLLERIVRTSCCKSANKGERIYWQGDTPRAFYHVLSGQVRRALASPVGEERVIDVLSPGQSFGLAELFGTSSYASFAEAVVPTVILQVDKDGLLGAIAESRQLTLRVLESVADHQARFERDVASCFFQSGTGRLIDYLIREAGPILRPFGDTAFQLPMSKSLIASRIGVTAETLSRALRELSDAGLIEVRGKMIILREELVAQHRGHAGDREVGVSQEQWNRGRSVAWVGGRRLAGQVASSAWM